MAPAYAMPRLLDRNELGVRRLRPVRDPRGVRVAGAGDAGGLARPGVQPRAARRDEPLGEIDRSKLNVNGGSLAAGHPFAATGGRIVASLAKALDERGSGRGVISICAAGGQGVVAILEKSMSDRYSQLVNLPVAGGVAKRIGLPQPVALERGPGELSGRVLLGGAGRMAEAAARVLAALGVDAATALDDPGARARRQRRSRRRRVQPRGAGRPALQGARVRRHRRGAGRAAPLLPSDRAARAAVRARGRDRGRAARAGGLHALARPRRSGAARRST